MGKCRGLESAANRETGENCIGRQNCDFPDLPLRGRDQRRSERAGTMSARGALRPENDRFESRSTPAGHAGGEFRLQATDEATRLRQEDTGPRPSCCRPQFRCTPGSTPTRITGRQDCRGMASLASRPLGSFLSLVSQRTANVKDETEPVSRRTGKRGSGSRPKRRGGTLILTD